MGSFSLKNKVLQILKRIVEDAEKGEKKPEANATAQTAPATSETVMAPPSPMKKNLTMDPMTPMALPPSSLIESQNQIRPQAPVAQQLETTGGDADEDETILISDWLPAKEESGLFNISTSSPTEESFKKAADNPNTSSGTLIWLANQFNVDIRIAVAKNPNSNLQTLTKLSMDKEVAVRTAVAANRNTCKEILQRLARDPHSLVSGEAQIRLQQISQTLKAQTAAPQAQAEKAPSQQAPTSQATVTPQAPSVQTPPAPKAPVLQAPTPPGPAPLTPAPIPQVQPPKAMPEFKRTAYAQDMTPPAAPSPSSASAIQAGDKDQSEEAVNASVSEVSKNLLAANPFGSTSNHIIASYTNLDALPKTSPIGKNAIQADSPKENWNTLDSQSAKTAYQQQKDTVKDFKFAHTPRTGPSQGAMPISMLPTGDQASDGDTLAFVLMLASRSGTPSMRLLELASHSNTDVRMAVAENPNTPKEAFYILAADKDTRIKLRVIDNGNCPMDLINSLRADPDPYVAYEAKNTLKRLQQFRPSYEVPDAF